MAARIIDGKRIADEIKREVKAEAERLKAERGVAPGLGFILVGDNPASRVYVKMKGKGCEEVGFYSVTLELPAATTESTLLGKIREFNEDERIHGLLVQLPLPKHINEEKAVQAVDPMKDVSFIASTPTMSVSSRWESRDSARALQLESKNFS
jgi:methylenetetrahydrofolate dehydrogenase (NADP+)/methenyltetrahydrofolate cyclohydrolase